LKIVKFLWFLYFIIFRVTHENFNVINRAHYVLEFRTHIVRAGLNTAGQISFHVYTGRIQRRQQLSSNWIRSVYTLRYSAKRVALLPKCYSIVVSAECAHWLRYSYRATLKTIVTYLYQSRAIVRSECIRVRIDAKELQAEVHSRQEWKHFTET